MIHIYYPISVIWYQSTLLPAATQQPIQMKASPPLCSVLVDCIPEHYAINSSGTSECRKNTLPPPTDGCECPTLKCNAKVYQHSALLMLPLLSFWDSFKKPSITNAII